MTEHNPYAPPKDDGASREDADVDAPDGDAKARVWIDGQNLAVARGAKIPSVCLKCAATSNLLRREQKLVWMPPDKQKNQLMWGALFGAVGGAIAAARHQRSVILQLPLCPRCDGRWTTARVMGWVIVAIMIGLCVLMYTQLQDRKASPVPMAIAFFGGLALVVVLGRVFIRPALIHAARIDDACVVLRGVDPTARDVVVERAERRAMKKRKSA